MGRSKKRGAQIETRDGASDYMDQVMKWPMVQRTKSLASKMAIHSARARQGKVDRPADMILEVVLDRDSWVLSGHKQPREIPKVKQQWERLLRNPNLKDHHTKIWELMLPKIEGEKKHTVCTTLREHGWDVTIE